MDDKSFSMPRLLLRSLTPGLTALVVEVFIAAAIIGLHILLYSTQLRHTVSAFASDAWIQRFTDFAIHPLEHISHNSTLNTVLTAIVWGFIGLVIYTGLEFAINAYQNWRSDQNEVRVIDTQKIQLHPLRRLRLVRILWRFLISILVVLLVIATSALSHHLLVQVDSSLNGTSTSTTIWKISTTVAVWTLLMHCFVVLLRLFMFRTRLSGEIIR